MAEQARYLKLVVNPLARATSSLLADMLDVIDQSAAASPLIGNTATWVVSGDCSPAFTVEQMIKNFGLPWTRRGPITCR